MIYIKTTAYNAQKTIRRCVESVLSQTYGEFVYYLIDNGSTDRTGEIAQEYAARDNSIRLFHNKGNHDWSENQDAQHLEENIGDGDYFCLLDADDSISPQFFEKLIDFIYKEDLDIACAGSNFLSVEQGNRLVSQRLLPFTMILEGDGFAANFFIYFRFMRAKWAKLYAGRTLRAMAADRTHNPDLPRYGKDTVFAMQSFTAAKRVGILGEALHQYYVSPQSVSYHLDEHRIKDNQLLFDHITTYLKKCDGLTASNKIMQLAIYSSDLIDTLSLVLKADMPESERFEKLCDMFLCDHSYALAAAQEQLAYLQEQIDNTKQIVQPFSAAVKYLLKVNAIPAGQVERYCELGEFLSAASENADAWLAFKKLRALSPLEMNRQDESEPLLNELSETLANVPL